MTRDSTDLLYGIIVVDELEGYPGYEAAEQIDHGLAEVEHERQGLGIGLRCSVDSKHLDYGVMPRAGAVGGGHQYSHAAGGKAGQSGYWTDGRCGWQTVESQIQFKIVAQPDAYRVDDKQWQASYLLE